MKTKALMSRRKPENEIIKQKYKSKKSGKQVIVGDSFKCGTQLERKSFICFVQFQDTLHMIFSEHLSDVSVFLTANLKRSEYAVGNSSSN